ncbi:hypothetical protein LTR09_009912 [Extremus antarcticus]|uniref:Uncharacterized protein n=1 Tax=Extremus antarcticus TaxID=702011 RepID=A0AAJ0G5X7_9PEZI|nr:hypothetical protein LTR09_009912 [Extremus antarcticus]
MGIYNDEKLGSAPLAGCTLQKLGSAPLAGCVVQKLGSAPLAGCVLQKVKVVDRPIAGCEVM